MNGKNISPYPVMAILETFMDISMHIISTLTDCKNIGIRVEKDNDFPFVKTTGFTKKFLQEENFLRKKEDSDAEDRELECICGMVATNRHKGLEGFFNEYGTFWINNIETFKLALEDHDSNLRKSCIDLFESLAIIPCQPNGKIEGILLIADKHPDLLSERIIDKLEKIGKDLAIFITGLEDLKKYIEDITERKTNSRVVLIVDDDKAIRELLSDCIRVVGYKTIGVSSGNDAMNILKEQKIDIVITDHQMVGMSGVELAEQIYKHWQHYGPPVILITGAISTIIDKDINSQIIAECIEKPLNMSRLFKAIDRFLR